MSSIVPIEDVPPYVQIIASSGQLIFDTPFTADDDADVVVYARAAGSTPDDTTDLVSSADYTVTFVGVDEEVRVTFNSGRTLNDIVTIMRATPVDRLNLYTNTNFQPSMLNGDFGKQTMMIQEREYATNSLAPKYYNNATVPSAAKILPVPPAGYGWRMNAAGTAIEAVIIPDGGSATADGDFITFSDETATLPNSVQIQNLADELTSGMGLPAGTTAQRVVPSGNNIGLRYNTTLAAIEYYDGAMWVQLDDADLSQYLLLAGGTMTGNINMGANKVTDAADPTNPQDYTTKFYVDQTALSGTSVYAATTANLNATQAGAGVGATLTDASGTFAAFTTDGQSPAVGDFILDKNQTNAAHQGIYELTTNGDGVSVPWVLTRSTTYNTPAEINKTGLITVRNGTTLAGTQWYNSSTIVTVDTTNFSYSEFGSSYVESVTGTANEIDVDNTDSQNPVLSLPAVMNAPGTFNIQSTTAIDEILDEDNMASDSATALATQQSIKYYADHLSQILDSNGNEVITFTGVASAVNYLDIQNGATGVQPVITAVGTDADISISLQPKGDAAVQLLGTASRAGTFNLYENTGNGTNYMQVKAPEALSATDTIYVYQETNTTGYITADSVATPAWTDFSGSVGFTGFSVNPTVAVARYKKIGRTCFVTLNINADGTSNATGFTITGLPFTSSANQQQVPMATGTNNSTAIATANIAGVIGPSTSTLTLTINSNGAGWTASNVKAINGNFVYETA